MTLDTLSDFIRAIEEAGELVRVRQPVAAKLEMCEITDGDVVAVGGAGPVGQFAMDSARVLGAAKVIAVDPA